MKLQIRLRLSRRKESMNIGRNGPRAYSHGKTIMFKETG